MFFLWIAASLTLLAMTGMAYAATSIPFTINTSEAVNVTGTPRIAVDVGGTTRYATYTSGSGTNALTFTYAMVAGDVDLDGVALSSPIDLNGGTLKDLNGNDATLTFTPPNTSNVKVNYPSLGMDFVYDADGRYTLNGTVYNDLTSFLTAAGGTFTRASTATYFDSTGTLQTAAANQPRFDYDPVTHAAKGILIEESRVNYIPRSSNFDTWNLISATSITNALVSPSNQTDAQKIIAQNSSNVHVAYLNYTTTIASYYTFSVYLKASNYAYVGLTMHPGTASNEVGIRVDLTNGTLVGGFSRNSNMLPQTYAITSAGNGWYRVSISQNFTTVNPSVTCHIWLTPDTTTSISATWTGDNSSGIYAWGAQLEQGAFPTSYIPTTSAAVTRVADALVIPAGSWLNSLGSTIFANASSPLDTTSALQYAIASLDDTTAGNRMQLRRYAASGGRPNIRAVAGGATIFDGNGASIWNDELHHKIAGTFKTSDSKMYFDGVSQFSNSGTSLPTITQMQVGAGPASTNLNGTLKNLKYYPTRVSDTQLQLLTQ